MAGVPFDLPPWRKRQIKNKFRRKDKVIFRAVDAMESIMETAVDYIIDHYTQTKRYAEPTLNSMYAVSDIFYRSVIEESILSSQEEKGDIKKLALKAPPRMPKNFDTIENSLRDRRYWSRVLKRSKKLTDSLRRQYLKKLRGKFTSLLPLIEAGEIEIRDLKKQMMSAWDTSKSRVETIFRTETTNYFAQTQVSFFSDDPEIIGFLFDSVRDSSRTAICQTRHGLVYRPGTELLKKNTPACHYNCRSHLIALANIPYNRKLLEDPKRNPEIQSVAPLPTGWRK